MLLNAVSSQDGNKEKAEKVDNNSHALKIMLEQHASLSEDTQKVKILHRSLKTVLDLYPSKNFFGELYAHARKE